jgi:hypothetical protein
MLKFGTRIFCLLYLTHKIHLQQFWKKKKNCRTTKTNWASRPIRPAGPSCLPPADLYRPSDWIRWPPITSPDPPSYKYIPPLPPQTLPCPPSFSQQPRRRPRPAGPSLFLRPARGAPSRPFPLPPPRPTPPLPPPRPALPIPSVAAAVGAPDPSRGVPAMTRRGVRPPPPQTTWRLDPLLPRAWQQWRGVVRQRIRLRAVWPPPHAPPSSSGAAIAAPSSTRLRRLRLRPWHGSSLPPRPGQGGGGRRSGRGAATPSLLARWPKLPAELPR